MSAAALRLALYAVAALLPLGLAVATDPSLASLSPGSFADAAALVALAILALQPVLSARLQWIARPFGLDRVLVFHRAMAVTALVLLCAHPVLLAAGDYGWPWLVDMGVSWPVWVGKAALFALIGIAASSLYRAAMRLRYGTWLRLHDFLAIMIVAGGIVHAWMEGPHCSSTAARALWLALALVGLGALLYRYLWRNRRDWAAGVRVIEVKAETPNVWTVRMALPGGGKPYGYLPGQFHFLTLRRACGGPVEQHPFTIVSSPTGADSIASTIKASGDYTATIGRTAPGDRAALDGPYGRFSYLLCPDEKILVFVAGGIGITPFMSMLRHMRDTRAALDVLLFYGNRTEQDIAFRSELDAIAAGEAPRLRVIHVLSQPGPGWAGERGRVTVERIQAACKDLRARTYYICGPGPMMKGLVDGLRAAGVDRRRIRFEQFRF